MDNIELLNINLLKRSNFEAFKYWKKISGLEPGWHYPLDIVWILQEIKKLHLPKGASIVDAGGGYGLLQFILAAKGYNVTSVDLSRRKIPLFLGQFFNIEVINSKKTIQNKYVKHLKSISSLSGTFTSLLQEIKNLITRNIYDILRELLRGRHSRGTIIFYQTDFAKMKLIKSDSFDALVSVSAIEHVSNRSKLPIILDEFARILKPGSKMIITTSASNNKTWFHTPSQGWCFSKEDLSKLFKIKTSSKIYEDYNRKLRGISGSIYLRKNIPKYYYGSKKCGLPMGKWEIKYLPVGIVKLKP